MAANSRASFCVMGISVLSVNGFTSAVAHTFSQLLDEQPNFVFGLAGHVRLPAEAGEGRDKIQLRFQKRSLAAEEPANFEDAPFLL